MTLTLAGTVAALLFVESVTVTPALGAGPLSATVPVLDEALPPETDAGFTVTPVSDGALIVNVLIWDEVL